jgi:hypothetical protein
MITEEFLQAMTSNIAVVLGVVTLFTTAAAVFVNAVTNVVRLAVALSGAQTLGVNVVLSSAVVAALMAALGIEPTREMFGLYVLVVVSVAGASAGVYQLNKAAIKETQQRGRTTQPLG